MTILIDADGVLEDLTQKWVVYLNEEYGTSVRYGATEKGKKVKKKGGCYL